jgi:hypothetical protein
MEGLSLNLVNVNRQSKWNKPVNTCVYTVLYIRVYAKEWTAIGFFFFTLLLNFFCGPQVLFQFFHLCGPPLRTAFGHVHPKERPNKGLYSAHLGRCWIRTWEITIGLRSRCAATDLPSLPTLTFCAQL